MITLNQLTGTTLKILPFLFMILSFSLFGQESETKEYFTVEVEQKGKVKEKEGDVIELKKKPFTIHLTMQETDHVYVSFSWGTYYYDFPDDQSIFTCESERYSEDCKFVAIKTCSEEKFNTDKDIIVGDGSYQCVWFYEEDTDWYRMDEGVEVIDGVIHATVTVENIFDGDKRDERIHSKEEVNYPVKNIEQDIYVVFATSKYESGMSKPEELQREKFIIKFK